jgi:hypothetical protein
MSMAKRAPRIGNGKKLATQQSVDAAIWSICDVMRRGNVANRKVEVDMRTPAELLDLIEAKGREVATALAALRNLPAG